MAFYLANPDGVAVPRTIEKSLAVGQEFPTGSLLLMDGDGNFAEVGADPAAIAAVSVSGAGADDTGYVRFQVAEFPPGKMQGMALAGNIFKADYIGALPDQDGGDYGVAFDATKGWCIDFDEVTEGPFRLVNRQPIELGGINQVLVKANEAYIQPI